MLLFNTSYKQSLQKKFSVSFDTYSPRQLICYPQPQKLHNNIVYLVLVLPQVIQKISLMKSFYETEKVKIFFCYSNSYFKISLSLF